MFILPSAIYLDYALRSLMIYLPRSFSNQWRLFGWTLYCRTPPHVFNTIFSPSRVAYAIFAQKTNWHAVKILTHQQNWIILYQCNFSKKLLTDVIKLKNLKLSGLFSYKGTPFVTSTEFFFKMSFFIWRFEDIGNILI